MNTTEQRDGLTYVADGIYDLILIGLFMLSTLILLFINIILIGDTTNRRKVKNEIRRGM